LSDAPWRWRAPAAIRTDVAERLFAMGVTPGPSRIGVEVECIPVLRATGHVLPVTARSGPTSTQLLREVARRARWVEESSPYGVPRWRPSAGGVLSFEPGGQLEYASPPLPTVDLLLRTVAGVLAPLHEVANGLGVELRFVGVDPCTPLTDVPLQLTADRYRLMDAYFATRGTAGQVMMRQTASLQINVDLGEAPLRRWRVLNAAVPVLLAMFANSPLHAGAPTGHVSWRAHLWRELDPLRTGVRGATTDAVGEYLGFALAAPWMFHPTAAGDYRPFGDWLTEGVASLDDWRLHLTTLFPEVRPRGHLELRSLDSVPLAQLAAPLALVAGLLADAESLRAAELTLPAPDLTLLRRAGRLGVHDHQLLRLAEQLADIAIAGYARRYPESEAPLAAARRFVAEWTRRGRVPADAAVAGPLTPARSSSAG
jgi:glutamate--cysteine ligase